MRLVRGRWLTDFEPSPAWVINETLARRHFGDSDPVGARFRVPYVGPESWATVVGVVADRKLQRLDAPAEPELYIDYAHVPTVRLLDCCQRDHRCRGGRGRRSVAVLLE